MTGVFDKLSTAMFGDDWPDPFNVAGYFTSEGIKDVERNFIEAAERHDNREVIRCLELGVNPNCYSGNNKTALHVAAARGDIPLGLLLTALTDLDINARIHHGLTALHYSVIFRRFKFVRLLLKNNADVNARTYAGHTSLHFAVRMGDVGMTLLLLKFNADVNAIDFCGNSALSCVILDKPSLPLAKLLIKYGADINFNTGRMHLFLECVLACNSPKCLECLKLLLDFGVNINMAEPIGKKTALHLVAITGYHPLARELIKRGADYSLKDCRGCLALETAINHENWEVVVMLKQPQQIDLIRI